MKNITFILILFLNCMVSIAQATKDEILGLWYNEDKTEIIEIYTKDNYYYAKLHWLKNSQSGGESIRDVYNENPSLRSRVLTGIDILIKFEYNVSKEKWKSGEIYNYKNGNTYNGKMRINSEGELEVHGYWWILSFLGSTKTYHKVK